MKHICFISSAFGRDDSLIVMRQGRSLAESGFQVTYLVCDDQPDAFDKGIHYISTGYKPKSKKDDVVVIKDVRPREAIAYNKKNETKFKPLYIPKLKRVQFSPPATIAWFEDGSKSVAVAGHGDEYDKETGLAICMLKRVLGNKEYRRIMDEHCYVNKEMLS